MAGVVHVDAVDQAELVDVDWDFGIVDLPERLDDLAFEELFFQRGEDFGGRGIGRQFLSFTGGLGFGSSFHGGFRRRISEYRQRLAVGRGSGFFGHGDFSGAMRRRVRGCA